MAHVFLIGFMAAGKTSVGRALAASTGRIFIDLDDAVQSMDPGEPVPALVARDLPEFRRREAQALARLCAAPEAMVIATGGGAATFGDNLERMRAAGLVIALGVDAGEAAPTRSSTPWGSRSTTWSRRSGTSSACGAGCRRRIATRPCSRSARARTR